MPWQETVDELSLSRARFETICQTSLPRSSRFLWQSLRSVLLAVQPAYAQTDFYAGKTIRLIVGASAGGGYDLYARAFAPFISAHLPGKPNVIVQNMPGGGGLTSVLFLDASAPKDGTVVTTFNSGVLTDAFTSQDKAKVDLRTLGWLGSANRSFRFCYFWHSSGIKTWDDLDRQQTGHDGCDWFQQRRL